MNIRNANWGRTQTNVWGNVGMRASQQPPAARSPTTPGVCRPCRTICPLTAFCREGGVCREFQSRKGKSHGAALSTVTATAALHGHGHMLPKTKPQALLGGRLNHEREGADVRGPEERSAGNTSRVTTDELSSALESHLLRQFGSWKNSTHVSRCFFYTRSASTRGRQAALRLHRCRAAGGKRALQPSRARPGGPPPTM